MTIVSAQRWQSEGICIVKFLDKPKERSGVRGGGGWRDALPARQAGSLRQWLC